MKRSPFVRIQTFLLVIVCGLVIWRATSGPSAPSGVVTLTDIEVGDLQSTAFELDRDGRVRIEATGSAEREATGPMAAYAWILDRTNRELAWRLLDGDRDSGPFLVHRVDTVALAAGTYDVYYTSFGMTRTSRRGSGFLRLKPHWTNDASAWSVAISAVDSLDIRTLSAVNAQGEQLWSSNRDGDPSRLLVSTGPSVANVAATGMLCESGCDDIRIEDAVTGETVWVMTMENSRPAGGSDDNRSFDGTVSLQDGVYRVAYSSRWGHRSDDWVANPPLDPTSWGVRLSTGSGDLSIFDPWSDRSPVVSMLRAGDDQLLRTTIEVSAPTRVFVDALGELMDGGSRYDYAWIERADTRERIWEQTGENSEAAGGDDSNRRATAFLTLEPGKYGVYYQTDGSYSFGSFSRAEPDHPERWGVALFVVGTPAEQTITVVESVRDAHEDPLNVDLVPTPNAPPPPIPPVAGESLFEAIGIGNQQNIQGHFELGRATRVRIVAIGELMSGNRYDYGWIESASGEVVWEMSMSNTVPAGGDDRNRLFDNVITLPAGRYRAHFETDFSHAFGDFESGAPADPGAYGMRIVRMPE